MVPYDWTKQSALAVDLQASVEDEVWRIYNLASWGAIDAPVELRSRWAARALEARTELADRGQFSVPCPCCGHLTLHSKDYYELCPVCFWENDPHQLEDPLSNNGANGYSLLDGQRNFAQTGSSNPTFAGKVRRALDSESLDPGWRPIDR
jgi:Cysteine-rich CPCC